MLLIVGCNNIVAMSQKELLTTEGFIAVAVAVNQRGIKIEEEKQALIIKQEAEEKAKAAEAAAAPGLCGCRRGCQTA